MASEFEGNGVFPAQWLRRAIDEKLIVSTAAFDDAGLQPASLDLRLGETAYRLQCGRGLGGVRPRGSGRVVVSD